MMGQETDIFLYIMLSLFSHTVKNVVDIFNGMSRRQTKHQSTLGNY